MKEIEVLRLTQLIVRGSYINIDSRKNYSETSSIYRFTNEDITSYFHHLKNKRNVLTVIGSGGQILNSILAGTKSIDCFDISIFPEYYLYLQLASIISLSKEDYLKYHFSIDREELFGEIFYEKISLNLRGKYKKFWDTLYSFDDGVDIYNSLLFRHDTCIKKFVLENNPYLQNNNYEILKNILQKETININTSVTDITKKKFSKEYDLVNLSNILCYYFNETELDKYIEFLKNNFILTGNGEIINYFIKMKEETEDTTNKLLQPNGYVENISNKKLLVYKKQPLSELDYKHCN